MFYTHFVGININVKLSKQNVVVLYYCVYKVEVGGWGLKGGHKYNNVVIVPVLIKTEFCEYSHSKVSLLFQEINNEKYYMG